MDVEQEPASGDPGIDRSSQECRDYHWRQRQQVEPADRWRPEAGKPVTAQSCETGRKKVSLQSRPKVLRRPPAERTVYGQRRAIHSIGAAQYACTESEQPRKRVVLQLKVFTAKQ